MPPCGSLVAEGDNRVHPGATRRVVPSLHRQFHSPERPGLSDTHLQENTYERRTEVAAGPNFYRDVVIGS